MQDVHALLYFTHHRPHFPSQDTGSWPPRSLIPITPVPAHQSPPLRYHRQKNQLLPWTPTSSRPNTPSSPSTICCTVMSVMCPDAPVA